MAPETCKTKPHRLNSGLLTVDEEESLQDEILPLAPHVDNVNGTELVKAAQMRGPDSKKMCVFLYPSTAAAAAAAGLCLVRFQSVKIHSATLGLQ